MVNLIVGEIEVLSLVFCRLFGLLFFFPGSNLIPARVKVLVAIASSIMVAPLVEIKVVDFQMQVLLESAVGAFVGLMVSVIFSAVNIAGTMVVFQSGLMYSALSDSSDQMGGSLVKFFVMVVVVLLLQANIHVLMLSLLVESYNYLRLDDFLVSSDLLSSLLSLAGASFTLAFKVAAPILVSGTIMYFCSALINRLIPSIQAFFIFAPLQIWLSLFIFMLAMSEMALHIVNVIMEQIDAMRSHKF